MTDLPPESLDDSLYDYFVVFYMQGSAKRFQYEVSKATYARVREALEDEEIGNIVFEAYRPVEQIVINSRLVQLARFLWRPQAERQDVRERGDTIDLYFAGRLEPIRLRADDPDEVFDLMLALETEAFSRCSIVDAGGEEAVIDLRKLVCAELPLGLAQQGEANTLLELEEEA